jgi:hypothetical protein
MKFLKKSQLNFRNVKDNSIAVQITGEVTLDTPKGLTLPRGDTGNRLSTSDTGDLRGMIRYNTTTDEVEVYQGLGGRAAWRSLRYKESTEIIQQDLGVGDDVETLFGPLLPAPPTSDLVDDKSDWGGQNLLVFVENVMQLYNTNYLIVQNPAGLSSPTGPHGNGVVGQPYPAGWYIQFQGPVPIGTVDPKHVTVLHGFDR